MKEALVCPKDEDMYVGILDVHRGQKLSHMEESNDWLQNFCTQGKT